MKKLLEKIREILRDRRNRRLFTRIVSVTAAIVVFVTTYALVLPAITMETEANCGIPAHQHDDSCYEDQLICGQAEDPGHHHTDACYTTVTSLICTEPEHQHDDACYDEAGNLICGLSEHTHDDACYEETRELACGMEEYAGHQHTDACYKRVLTCGMEAHTHSAACYSHASDGASASGRKGNSNGATGGSGASAEDYAVVAATTEAAGELVDVPTDAGAGLSGLPAAEDVYVPELESLFFDQLLTQTTGIYYFHPEEGETIPENTADITEWIRVKDDTDLAPADMLRVYLRYTIPAGSLNSTNPVARYRLPSNLHLTDQQMEEINTNVNGIAGQYINLDTLEILDPDQYNQYLGIEAVEGTRTPADDIDEYFDKHPDMNRQEYISATVRVEDVYDTEGLYGEKDAYLGQDLIFAFTPYTVQKNQHEYDADGQPTKAGEKVDGWLCLDVHMDQIDWSEPVVTTETVTSPEEETEDINADTGIASGADSDVDNTANVDTVSDISADKNASTDITDTADSTSNIDANAEEVTEPAPAHKTTIEQKESTAEVIFAAEDKALKIDEISTNLHMIERTEITSEDDVDKEQDEDTALDAENGDESGLTDASADEDSENPDKISPDGKSGEEELDGMDDASADADPAIEINAENYPAVSFEDSIVVRAGTLSTDNESASKDTPEETTIAVSVTADVETFPRGTTMVLSAVNDMDAVASAVEGAVEGQTRGFHAVDISFIDPDGKEIEPLKPIKVSMTSEAIKQAVEDSSTVPVVVHVENPVEGASDQADSAAESAKADPTAANSTSNDSAETDVADVASHTADQGTDHVDHASVSVPTATIVESNEATSTDNAANKKDTADTLSFDADSFSVYAIVYTVDFHYEVDGKMYEFSIPGGGFASFYKMVEVLGISEPGTQSGSGNEKAEGDAVHNVVEEAGVEDTGAYSDVSSLNNVEVSEVTRQFVADVASVEFSSPELVWVGKVDETATVGGLKEANGLEVQYSVELTEEQIAEINGTVVESGDWALISMLPFTSEESLTVTMKNGDQFVVKVTDENITVGRNIDSSEGMIIYTIIDGKYYALNNQTGNAWLLQNGESDLETLGNDFKWKIQWLYQESGFRFDYGYNYYNIRSFNDDSVYLYLVNESNIVKNEAANTFIINHPSGDGSYALGGIHSMDTIIGSIPMATSLSSMSGGQLYADTGNYLFPSTPPYAHMYIYQQNATSYEFVVQTEDIRKGTVSGTNKDDELVTNDAVFISRTTSTSDVSNKTNLYPITATPSSGRMIFSHWTLNDQRLTDLTSATIPAGALRIPDNGAVLEAHFDINPNYEPTDKELEGRDAIDKEHFDAWLNEKIAERDPLVESMCNKTAEVYDYENRIYRVDLTAGSKMPMFNGDVNLAFLIDVSASMKFPSNLINATDVNNNTIAKNLRNIEQDWSTWGLSKSKTYYVITDPEVTATVCCLWWNGSHWMMRDASKGPGNDEFRADIDNKGAYYASNKPHTLLIKEATDLVTGTETGSMAEAIQNAGLSVGDAKTRRVYLEASIKDAIKEMYSIKTRLGAANNSSKDYAPKIAYNQFCGYINGFNYTFQTAPVDGNIVQNYAYAGGTSTDVALLDAAGYLRSDVKDSNGNGASHTGSNSSSWDREPYHSRTYTKGTGSYGGFQWGNGVDERYALLITDGAPQRSSQNIDSQYLVDGKNYLTGQGVTLVSVGLSMKDVKIGSQKLYNISSQDDLGVPYYYKADTGDKLSNVIYETLQSSIADVIVTGKITDTVNEAFYPVDRATGNPLEAGDWVDLNGNLVPKSYTGKHGVIKASNGKYSVEWDQQSISNTGWHGSLYIKAKEDLFGGNAVQTNDGKAKIEVSGFKYKEDAEIIELKSEYKESVELSSPRVNINELSFPKNDSEWTVYVGTEVDPLNELKALYNQIEITQVINAGSDTNGNTFIDRVAKDNNTSHAYNNNMYYPLPQNVEEMRSDGRESQGAGTRKTMLMKDFIKNLQNGQELDWDKLLEEAQKTGTEEDLEEERNMGITIPYNVYGINDGSKFVIRLTKEIVENEPDISENPHTASVVGNAVEKYVLSVDYEPDYTVLPTGQTGQADIADFHVGQYESKYQGNAAGKELREYQHIINVYAEPVDVLKKDEEGSSVQGATFGLFRAVKDGETGEQLKKYDPSFGDAYYYCIDTAVTNSNGIAQLAVPEDGDTSQNLLIPGETYYLIETIVPAGYKRDSDASVYKTVTVETTDGVYTKLDKQTAIQNKTYPFNWNQGVTVNVDGNAAMIVDSTTRQGKNLGRNYVLKSDLAAFQVEIRNILSKSTDIRILKVKEDGTTGLPGAVFQLYIKDGSYRLAASDDGISGLESVTIGDKTYASAFRTDGNELILSGMEDGDYQLREVHVPGGYVNTIGDINFNLTNGVMTLQTSNDKLHLDLATEGSTPTLALLKITNEPGAALPSTGGPGTRIFYLLGLLLTAIAGAGLMMKNRRKNKA